MRLETTARALLVLFLALPLGACERQPATKGPGHGGAEEPEKGKEPRRSDLDRPVEELFAAVCEHAKRTFECDECRYELGVARASSRLFEGGLLRTEKATREQVEIPLRLTGEVRFDERLVVHLSTQAEGIVRKVHIALGDRVKKGQAQIEIDSVAVGEAEGAYFEARAILGLARRNHERVTALRAEAVSSEREFLRSQQELEAAEIRAESALGKLTRLGVAPADVAALTTATGHGRLVLRAPEDGTVLSLHAVSGEVAKTDQSLATIGDNTTVWVWADLYERDIALVTRKQQENKLSATVAVNAYPGEEIPGTVDFLSPSMDEASRTVRIRVEVKNPKGRLLAGMFANVKVLLPGGEALVLPRSAVLEDGGRAFVFVHHHDDYYVRRPVKPGRAWDDRVEVVEGLAGGETIVSEGAFLLKSDVLRSKMGAGCAD